MASSTLRWHQNPQLSTGGGRCQVRPREVAGEEVEIILIAGLGHPHLTLLQSCDEAAWLGAQGTVYKYSYHRNFI